MSGSKDGIAKNVIYIENLTVFELNIVVKTWNLVDRISNQFQ